MIAPHEILKSGTGKRYSLSPCPVFVSSMFFCMVLCANYISLRAVRFLAVFVNLSFLKKFYKSVVVFPFYEYFCNKQERCSFLKGGNKAYAGD